MVSLVKDRYFLFHNAHGDDNDQHIGDVLIHAPNRDGAFDFLRSQQRDIENNPGCASAILDGDGESVTILFYEKLHDAEDCDEEPCCDDEYCERSRHCQHISRPFHDDYTLVGSFGSEDDARAELSSWHSLTEYDLFDGVA